MKQAQKSGPVPVQDGLKRILSDQDRSRLDRLIAEGERRTKTQIVLAVIKRCDAYPELPWKAFALAASIAGLAVFTQDFPGYAWSSRMTALIAAASILAGGAVFALLTVFVPAFARFFLSRHRARTEVRQYAESIFLSRELFATRGRTGVLLLVSLFERRVVLLPDKGLRRRLTHDAMKDIIAVMALHLRRNKIDRALQDGLERLIRHLEASKPARPSKPSKKSRRPKNELSDEIIEEKGV